MQQGAFVILSGRREAALQSVAAQAAERALVLPFESTDYAALPLAVERARTWRGRIDCLINNAGVSQRSLALDTHFEVYRQLMEVDYLAPVALTQLLLPHLVAQGGGQLAVVSSVAGKVGAPLRTGYCAAKHAVIGYFEALRAEVEQAYGISISVILPGSVHTSVATNALSGDGSRRGRSDINIDNGMQVEEAARRIVEGLAAGQRTIEVAEGAEKMALFLRNADPDRLFALTAAEGARLTEERARNGSAGIEPGDVQHLGA